MRRYYLMLVQYLVLVSELVSSDAFGFDWNQRSKDYWYDGKAEISTYKMKRNRYGQPRDGLAVLVFVTEDFSKKKLVKKDFRGNDPDKLSVMKLNHLEDFQTGIYPYRTMLSSFSALQSLDKQHPAGRFLKSTYSSQEWCGHVFQETKLKDHEYIIQTNSYFEGESGKEVKSFSGEDELLFGDFLFLAVRGFGIPSIRPGEMKKIKYLPTSEFVRLKHQPQKIMPVSWTMSEKTSKINVPAGEFEVFESRLFGANFDAKIWIASDFPHKIIRWQFGGIEGESGELRASRRAKYWSMLSPDDEKVLPELGLKPIGSLID